MPISNAVKRDTACRDRF